MPVAKFTHLAPVKNADPEGIYRTALDYAMTDENIRNIALTGPYGSGKSSIIRTYEEQRSYRFLNISLACFKEDKDQPNPEALNTQHMLIERSILQQMLYGVDAAKLTYSRFKKISSPKHEIHKAFAILFWLLSVAFIVYNKSSFLNLTFFENYFSFGVCLVAISLSLPVLAIVEIIRSSYKVTFSKLSLTNAEIEIKEKDENSILNRHLDEIIYFFQAARYDAVVIEDLDRFGSPEIFVKLREINKLVNENSNIKWPVRFIYALKDDMFVNEDRSKFFEYIIPVIPVINSSNSEEKFLSKLNEIPGSDSIEKQFIKDISYYVDDLRLIYNILNEFIVYSNKINSSNIDKTKLLAMLLYKNVYPGDFEKLHDKKGIFFDICAMKHALVGEKKGELAAQIKELRERIIASEHEEQIAVMDLISLFIGYIVSQQFTNIGSIICNGKEIALNDIKTWDNFKGLFGATDLTLVYFTYHNYNNSYIRQTIRLSKSFTQIESTISPHASFLERKENIENKAKANRQKLQQKIHIIELERNNLAKKSLCQLLSDNDKSVENIANDRGLVNPELFSYLVEHGYLNEEYHIYISNFHEVKMTRRDREFIISVLSGKKIEPGYTLDTPEEVCNDMREDAFSSKYALNVTLIVFLLENRKTNNFRLKAVFSYIAENLNNVEDFFISYWTTGKKVPEFTNLLSENDPDYGIHAIGTTLATDHIALILSHIPSETISKTMNGAGELSAYISTNSFSIFSSPYFSLKDLKTLHALLVKFPNLEELSSFGEIVDHAYSKNLYIITKENILFLMKKYSVTGDASLFESANYTSLERAEFATLKKYVNENLAEYIDSVFLTLPQNTKETFDVIKLLLNDGTLDLDTKKAIVSKQEYVFPDFTGIPYVLWEQLISEDKVTPSWEVVFEYFSHEVANADLLTEKFQNMVWLEILSASLMSKVMSVEDEQKKSLSRFIFENDALNQSSYAKLIKDLPYRYRNFPAVSMEKKYTLAEIRRVKLTEDSFAASEVDRNLRVLLLEKNAGEYLSSKNNYPIDDNIREILLQSSLTIDQKIEICHDVTSAGVNSSKNLAKVMAEILAPDGVDCTKINIESMKALIANGQSIENSIRLLNKFIPNWSESDTMSAIAALPSPFSDIAAYGKRPKLDKNELNSRFVGFLKSKDFISNCKEEDNSIRINTYKSVDHSEGNNS